MFYSLYILDTSYVWSMIHTRLLLGFVLFMTLKSLLYFLCSKYECSRCFKILRRERKVHLNKKSYVWTRNYTTGYPYTVAQNLFFGHNIVAVTDTISLCSMERCHLPFLGRCVWWGRMSHNLQPLSSRTLLELAEVVVTCLYRLLQH